MAPFSMREDESESSKRRRQDPVSCRLCRLKKLKCNRSHPCSNCVARKTECEFETNYTTTSARIQQDAEPSNSAIMARIQRLEDMILRMGSQLPTTPDSISSRRPESDAPTMSLTPAEETHQIESQDLNSIGTEQPSLFPAMSCSFVFDIVPLEFITKYDSSSLDAQPMSRREKRILLPTYADARAMFDKYVKYVCHFHHIVHLPTLGRILENLYLKHSRREPIDTDHAALLLSVFTTVLCYTAWSEPGSESMKASEDQVHTFLPWFRSVLDLLDHSRRVLPASVEIVQTAIIIVFLDYNLEGFTSRARAILAQAIYSAKDLGLHRLDAPNITRRREGSTAIDSVVDIEIKRRIYWHLCATDWLVSLAGSMQEGTYNAHPQQMRVCLPRNIDDETLERGNITENLPLTHPTPMSYPLQRIRLGEISRNVVDALRFGISDLKEIDHVQVMQIDKRIENFLEDLPVFLKLDQESLQKSQYILERYPYFAMQRYIINIGARSIRCKLHQPYLVRGDNKPRFENSVKICLSSAISVVQINKAVREDPTRCIPEKFKLLGLLHHMFLATVVLVMDLCFNRTTNVHDQRSLDVKNAVRMLEDAKEQSASVQRFLDSLTEKLQKHHVRLPDSTKFINSVEEAVIVGDMSQKWTAVSSPMKNNQARDNGTEVAADTSLNATLGLGYLWQDNDGTDVGDHGNMPTLDWEALFSELDAFIA